MALIHIEIVKKYGVFIPCEKCGTEEAADRVLFDTYTARLCSRCIRDLQANDKANGEWKALVAAKEMAKNMSISEAERNQASELYIEIKKGLKSFIDEWLAVSSSSGSHRHQ